ncbi:MAG: LysR family transcriptional regulator [SAR324 cluster bacterium]|nr:LysR family transcriptional regulator [SAR324 cluster bacterium]
MDYKLLIVFEKVAQLGSFTKAAHVLGQPKSRVSRAIAKLEDELGVQLLRRTTRKTSLTSIGEEFFQNIQPLLAKIEDELVKVSNFQDEMSGVIRITAPEDLGQTLVAQIISAYTAKYPGVMVQAILTNNILDLTKENIDLSIRAGKLVDSNLIQKKLLKMNFIFVCSKNYVHTHGRPTEIKGIESHKFLSFRNIEKEFFKGKGEERIAFSPRVISDSLPMLLNLVLNGDGIAIIPDFFCNEHLDSGDLVRLFPRWQSDTEHVHILYPPSQNTSRKVKMFIETAMQQLSNQTS